MGVLVIEEGQTEVTAADGRPQLPEIPSVPGPLISTHEPANERRVSFTQASVHHIPSRPAIESDDYPPSSHPSGNRTQKSISYTIDMYIYQCLTPFDLHI